MAVRALRGATTVEDDTPDQVTERVQELLREVMDRNQLVEDDIISIIFTATADVVCMFPATAARGIGFGAVPLLCAAEIPVPGAMPHCVRVLLHVNTDLPREQLRHIYLHGAQGLRDDLPGRALLVGTGLIGGSLGLALRARGWHVTGDDADPDRARAALAAGALDQVGDDLTAELAFVATPSGSVAEVARRLLDDPTRRPDLVVTDVAGVKAPVVAAVGHPRFIGGHPMAGSEQVGLDGADPDLFTGATWVLTPTAATDLTAFAHLQTTVSALGADVVALAPADHDRLVAVVSHVPHLVAATLMNAASKGAEENAALLRLAAGGFRDMTRVAAGHPGIWPDICADNAGAIVAALDQVLGDLTAMRRRVAEADRDGLLAVLQEASTARRSLPARVPRPERLAELRVPVPDREGVLAEITTLAGDLGINIYDIEIAHSAEGPRGVLMLVVDGDEATKLRDAVAARNYRCTVQVLA